jgi:Zn-dependent metalloprotease
MRMLRLVVPALVASATVASAASAASTQQAAQDRFARDAQGARIVSAPATTAASTVTGTVSAKRLGVASSASPGTAARAAVNRYASLLGVSSPTSQLRYADASTDALGQRHVRFDQVVGDVPVYDGAVTVHLARGADNLTGFTAGVSHATAGAASQASVSADQARDVAPSQVADAKLVQAPRLFVYTGVPFGSHPATLAYAVDVTSTTQANRKLVFVDAASGQVTDALDRTEFAKNRTVYNANGSTTTGTFARGEGDPPTGNTDVDNAYDGTGATYDYYASNFGRDSYDGAGAELVSFVHYGVGYENAFWDGAEMVYGDGFAVNDVTAHELTHAVTERTAGLEYVDQSGALNESISDQAGWDVDPGDSTMGEDLPIGAIRDMRNPGAYGQPATASQYVCTSSDHGGVHTNSGIPNKVYANLVDALGRDGAEQVRYRAQTTYLGPNATFADARAAEQQAASDLGYSATTVGDAWQAQGVTASWQPSC